MQRWKKATIFGVLIVAVGCQKAPYELASVRGIVTIDGQPFNQGKVMFAPLAADGNPNPGKPALALLRPDGSFVLGTYAEDDGAVVGEHTVTIIRSSKISGGSSDGPSPSSAATSSLKFSRVVVPQKMLVAAGQDNEFSIALTSRDILRLGQLDN